MILQRLATSIRKQDWFTVLIETLIVVLGVFLGIQLGNWNDARSSHAQQQVYLERLEDDFGLIMQRLDSGIETYSASIEAAALLHDAILVTRGEIDGDLPDTEAMVAAAYLIGAGSVPPGSSATFEEMIAAGTFSELRDSDLRKALYDYDQSAQLSLAAWQSLRDQSLPYLREISPLLKMRILPSDPSGSVPVGIDETRLFGDPDVATALAIVAIGNANDLQLRQMQMERAKAVMAILDPDADGGTAP